MHVTTENGVPRGICRLNPVVERKAKDDHCGQHPDMPAWIKTEWPKVR
jgi:hypothetical protein